ncbi:hypothetical protein C8R43DRAFT_907621, partial [Mycena crocata]
PSIDSSPSPAPMDVEPERTRIHIEIEHHPHSGKPPELIPLDAKRTGESTTARIKRQVVPATRPPWAPFPSRADFEWAETMYMAPNVTIATQLKGMHTNWCGESHLKIKTVDDLKKCLERAKHYVVPFHEQNFDKIFKGEIWHFTFCYRDPWDWLVDLVSDSTLADEIVWYPSRKYLVVDRNKQRLRDEPYNSDKWWEMQVALPVVDGLPHCLLPILLWLDKGRVSSHTNMHPMILRPLFLRSQIRNASGNGGADTRLFQVQDRKEPEDRSQTEKLCFAKFKRDVYHWVWRTIFVETLQQHASGGKCVPCGDTIRRVLFPRLPIHESTPSSSLCYFA